MKTPFLPALLAVAIACRMAAAAADDSFLDKPLPTHSLKFASFQDWAALLRKYSGKTVILPDGVPNFFAKHPDMGIWFNGGIEDDPKDKAPLTCRDLLDPAGELTGLKWRYDLKKEALVLDFPWQAGGDTRANADLMKTLLETKPAQLSLDDYAKGKLDPWRKAFDALAGKPENKSIAWVVRWVAGQMQEGIGDISPVENFFTGSILDETGKQHLIILNDHSPASIPGEDYASFYLFDANGKIEEAGIMDGGSVNIHGPGGGFKVGLDKAKSRLTYHDGATDLVFAVEKSHWVLKEKRSRGKLIDPPVFPEQLPLGKMLLTVDTD